MIINRVHGGDTSPIVARYDGAWSGILHSGQSAEIAFFESGTLVVTSASVLVDLMLVGGGKTGANAVVDHYDYDYRYYKIQVGGKGGDGGKILIDKANGIALPPGSYPVTIAEANGETTITIGGVTYSSANGNATTGGIGGKYDYGNRTYPYGGVEGTLAFGETNGVPQLAAVSYKGATYNLNTGKYGASGGGGSTDSEHVGAGGDTGGGAGGTNQTAGLPGVFFGAGGGGGGTDSSNPHAGGIGFRGILLMRTHPTT